MDVAIVGNRYIASLFRLIGVETVEALNDDVAVVKVKEVAEAGNCRMLFVTERIAARLRDLKEKLLKERRSYPVLVIIPDFEGAISKRKQELRDSVNRSMGIKLKVGG
jgi:vacuolar-type H+-ATPase subunit F/Vma7